MRTVLSQEEKKARKRERDKKYYKEHKEYYKEYHKEYNKSYYKEYDKEYYKEYDKTQKGRARFLIRDYKRNDKKANRGECTLTSEWIIENIFSKSCVYCGESDWHELGCDRKDNALPHTEDNVVPCCCRCNRKKGKMSYEEYLKSISN